MNTTSASDQLISRVIHAGIKPMFILLILWTLKFIESMYSIDLGIYGVLPQNMDGLSGILTGPLIHGSYQHLFSNSVSFFVLASMLFFFYPKLAFRVFILIYLLSGAFVWIVGRPAYHIGISGVVYGLATYLFFSGIFRKNRQLAAISLFISFIYGGLIWGMLPLRGEVSFEAHIGGALVGLILALVFKSTPDEFDNKQPPINSNAPIIDRIGDQWKVESPVSSDPIPWIPDNYDLNELGELNDPKTENRFNYIFIPKEDATANDTNKPLE